MVDYTPKPGDTVKATLGDSVLYGTIHENMSSDIYIWIKLQDAANDIAIPKNDPDRTWQIEPWSPPVTFKPLTVVRLAVDATPYVWYEDDSEGMGNFTSPVIAFRDDVDNWRSRTDDWFEFNDKGIALALAAGKAEVLFEGVDE